MVVTMPAPQNPPSYCSARVAPGQEVFPWERYWVSANSSIQMGGLWDDTGGYLADPEDGFIGKHANSHLLKTDTLLTRQSGCIVLWGEPGMGKSQTVRSFLPTLGKVPLIALEFRDIPDSGRFERLTTESPVWRDWLAGTHLLTLVIDGVDEGLIKITNFVSYLADLLKECPRDRLQLILACRSLEWPGSEGQDLMRLWTAPKVAETRAGIFELCPLREKDVRLAAELILGSSKPASVVKFLRSVRQRQLVGLATRPLTLKMLLREFSEGAGFSKSHRQLYRRYSHDLCNEINPVRQRSLRDRNVPRLQVPAQQRERIAGRIASLLITCGRSAIWTGAPDQAAASDLTIAEICATPDQVQGIEFSVEPYMVEAVLESPLFWPKGNGRVGFFHQTFADCLAAEYLRNLPFPQIRKLLCRQDKHGEFVHPPLAEFAAWLAGESDELLQHLLRHDPETLLRSDVSDIKDGSKVALVDAILNKATAGELFDARGLERFFHTLHHPKLAAQLRPVINNRKANLIARRIALRIAERCAVTALFDDVFARVRDPRENEIQSLAASTLDDLANETTVRRLVQFLKSKRAKPLYQGVQLSLAHTTLKLHAWTLSEALPYLEKQIPNRDTSYHILAQHAVPADAEALLHGCLRWTNCFDTLSPYRALVAAAHDLGLARIQEPAIRRRLARAWWKARQAYQHDEFKGEDREGPTLQGRLHQDTILRRAFIADLAALGSVQTDDHVWKLNDLFRTEDFPEFFRLAQTAPAGPRKVYAQLAACTYDVQAHVSLLGDLLASLAKEPLLAAAFSWLRTWPLDAPETILARDNYRKSLQWQAKAEDARKKRSSRPDPVKAWERDITYIPKGNAKHWLTIAHNLFVHREGEKLADDENRFDLRTSPGWKYHDETARAAITASARRFLLEVPGNPQHPIGGNSEFDTLAYRALYLLRDEIKAGTPLGDTVRRNWLPIIFDEFSNADAHHLEMMAVAYGLGPSAMRQLLEERVLRDASRDQGLCLELREFALCWDQPLADFVIQLIVDKIDRSETVRCLTDHLAEHDGPSALKLWRQLQPSRSQKEDRVVAAHAALFGWRLFEYWSDLFPPLTANHAYAEKVFRRIETHDRRNFLNRGQPRLPSQFADLFLLLYQLFPPASDPPVPVGKAYSPTWRMEIGRLRDEMLQALVVLGTEEAAMELARLAEKVIPADRMSVRWRWSEALVAARRGAWQPPQPSVVLSLVEKANRRWLVDEGDLFDLVLESLARLEDNLTKQPNSLRRDFWKMRPGRGKTKYLSPHDEVEMSRRIATWLQSDLAPNRGITLQREVQVQWDKRTDLEIRAAGLAGTNLRPLEIILEVKGCWHPKLNTALRDQLVQDYLQRSGRTHGIYLIVWTQCARWQDPQDSRRVRWKVITISAARQKADTLAAPYNGFTEPYTVRAIVLDARL